MNMRLLVAVANIGFLFLLGAGIAAEAAEVRVLSNNSMREVMKEFGPKFERATGHKLVVELTAPREIEKRIRDGKIFDVVIGPEINFPKGQTVPGSVTPVARGVLAMAVRKGAPKPDISSPDAVKRSLLAAKSITFNKNSNPGIHIAKLLERWGIADQLKPKLIFDGNVRNLVEKGEAEIGVHILSALIDSPGIEVVGALPDDLQESDVTSAAHTGGGGSDQSVWHGACQTVNRFLPSIALVAACLWAPAAMCAYPERPIRYIVPGTAGSGPDIIARIVTVELSRQMGQPFVVDNQPGGAGTIGINKIVGAAPDGYTVGFGNILTLAINRSVLPSLPYDVDRDLLPIVQYTAQPNLLAVTPELPVKSVRELIDHARKNPGQLSYASGGNASSPHLSGELFKYMTGVDMVHVPYKGLPLAITDLTQGRVQLMFGTLAAVAPFVKAGKLRGLGVTSAKRTPIFPELPAVAEAGVPGFEVVAWDGAIAPAKVPQVVIARLNAEMNKTLALALVREKFANLGVEVVGGTSEQFVEHIRKEMIKWAEVVKRAGVKID